VIDDKILSENDNNVTIIFLVWKKGWADIFIIHADHAERRNSW